jgi:ABC-type bacteriocin/lantibiotic exporter with double-glycine peptidase domain
MIREFLGAVTSFIFLFVILFQSNLTIFFIFAFFLFFFLLITYFFEKWLEVPNKKWIEEDSKLS